MIITYDRNYPTFVLEINKFEEFELKTLKKDLAYIDNKTRKDNLVATVHIDLFKLETYSSYCIADLLAHLNKQKKFNFNNVYIYIYKNSSYLLKAYAYLNESISFVPIHIIEIDEPLNKKKIL